MLVNNPGKYITRIDSVVDVYKITDRIPFCVYGKVDGNEMIWTKEGKIHLNGNVHAYDIIKSENESDLDEVFKKQDELNKRIIQNFDSLMQDPTSRRNWFLMTNIALQQEISETVNELNFKWWKEGNDNWDNVKKELVDEFHFFVTRCIIAGMSSEELISMYMEKNKINHDRQDKQEKGE